MRHPVGLFAVLVGLGQVGCSSQERPADVSLPGVGGSGSPVVAGGAGGAAGTVGTGGFDRSCLDGSDWCAWSCSVGPESGTGDSAYPYCIDGQFTCPSGAQKVSTCPPDSCARRAGYCCDGATGAVFPPACGADGVRSTVCPDGTDAMLKARCIPADLGVSSCLGLDNHPCPVRGHECHSGVICRCLAGPADGLIWQCNGLIP